MSDALFNIRMDIPAWRERASELTVVEGPLDIWTDDVRENFEGCISRFIFQPTV